MRLRLILMTAGAALAVAAPTPAAAQSVTVSQTDSPDPVAQGGTVDYQVTITNPGPALPDLRAHIKLSRPGSQTPVDDSYRSANWSQGDCAIQPTSLECLFGPLPAGGSVTINAAIQANQSFAHTVTAYRCTAPPQCDFETDLGTSIGITQVNYPTEFSGSNKVKITGAPETCATNAFKVKAKAKKTTRFYAYLKGPNSEFGTPLPVTGISGRIKKAEGSRLKVEIPADELDPGFYQLKFAAKQKGGSQLKRSATFQVCGPMFGSS